MNVRDIIESWIRTSNPTDEELERAFMRKKICDECPNKSKGLAGVYICSLCSCPLIYNDIPIGKLYSNDTCPLNKW